MIKRGITSSLQSVAGFTLVEMMIIIVIAGIVVSMGIPTFSGLIRDQRYNTQSADIAGAINLARSEALNRGETVFVTAVDGADNTNEWGPGFRVWHDADGDSNFDDDDTEQIYLFDELADLLTLDIDDSVSANFTQIQFNSRGNLVIVGTPPIFMTLCDDSVAGESGRVVSAALSGQVKIETLTC